MAMGTRTTGPIHLFTRFRGTNVINYLGTCVAAPEPEHTKSRIPIMNDLAGRNEPFNVVKDGEHAVVSATMNRFDMGLWNALKALDSGGAGVGQEASFTRGTMVMGVSDFQLILFYQYAATAGAAGIIAGGVPDQNPVRQYNSVEGVAWKESTVGTRVFEIAVAFSCVSLYNASNLSFTGVLGNVGAGPGGAAGLYTENLSVIGTTPAALLALVGAAGV